MAVDMPVKLQDFSSFCIELQVVLSAGSIVCRYRVAGSIVCIELQVVLSA